MKAAKTAQKQRIDIYRKIHEIFSAPPREYRRKKVDVPKTAILEGNPTVVVRLKLSSEKEIRKSQILWFISGGIIKHQFTVEKVEAGGYFHLKTFGYNPKGTFIMPEASDLIIIGPPAIIREKVKK